MKKQKTVKDLKQGQSFTLSTCDQSLIWVRGDYDRIRSKYLCVRKEEPSDVYVSIKEIFLKGSESVNSL